MATQVFVVLFVLRLSRTTLLSCVLTLFHTEEKTAEEQWSLDEVASKTQQNTTNIQFTKLISRSGNLHLNQHMIY